RAEGPDRAGLPSRSIPVPSVHAALRGYPSAVQLSVIGGITALRWYVGHTITCYRFWRRGCGDCTGLSGLSGLSGLACKQYSMSDDAPSPLGTTVALTGHPAFIHSPNGTEASAGFSTKPSAVARQWPGNHSVNEVSAAARHGLPCEKMPATPPS